MTAREVREYRSVCKRLVEIEEKSKMLEELKRRKICLPEEEIFMRGLRNKFKVLGTKSGVVGRQREEIVSIALKLKLRDNNLHGMKMRRKRDYLRGRLEEDFGRRPSKLRNIIAEIKRNTTNHRKTMKTKNIRKIAYLEEKFGWKTECKVDDELLEFMGRPKVFVDDEFGPEAVKDPVVVSRNVELSSDELEVLRLGPKFCMFVDLDVENFDADVEESVMKLN